MAKAGAWFALARGLLCPGMRREVGRRLAQRLHSDTLAIGFRRSLGKPRQVAVTSRMAFTMQRLDDTAAAIILALDDPTLAPRERWERVARRRLLDRGIGRCFVAVTQDGQPCYLQWLFDAGDNDAIAAYFGGGFPPLGPGDYLLEGAYTLPRFRGLGIMPAAITWLIDHEAGPGATTCLGFIGADNVASMKGHLRCGFRPCMVRHQAWRLLRRRTRFEPLPADFATTHAAIFP